MSLPPSLSLSPSLSPTLAIAEHRYIKVTKAEDRFSEPQLQQQADVLKLYDDTNQVLPSDPLVASGSATDFSWQQQQWISTHAHKEREAHTARQTETAATPSQPMSGQTKSSLSDSAVFQRLQQDAYVAVCRDHEVRRILHGLVELITDKKRTDRRNRVAANAMQAAAKFFCAYVFKEFTDGVEAAPHSEHWSRVGGCTDPLIPSDAVAWPSMCDDFTVPILRPLS